MHEENFIINLVKNVSSPGNKLIFLVTYSIKIRKKDKSSQHKQASE